MLLSVTQLRARVTPEKYFTFSLIGLLSAFVLLPTAKWVANYYYLFVLLPAAVQVLTMRVPSQPLKPLLILWLSFAFWLLASGAYGGEFGYFKHWGYLVAFCVVMVSWVEFPRFRTPRFFEACFVTLGAYILLSTFWLWAQGSPVGERILELPLRLSGPILTSMLLVALLTACLPTWHSKAKAWRIALAFVLVLFCVGFVLQSRSGLVGLVAVTVGYCCYLFMLTKGWFLRLVVLILVSVTLVSVIWALGAIESLQMLVSRGDSGRLELWSAYLRELGQCGLVWGCGPSFVADIYILDGMLLVQHPHNIFLVALVYHGLLALILLLVLCCATLWHAWRQKNPWGLYLLVSLLMLQFDGNRLVNRPDEIWLLVYLPCMLILAEALRSQGAPDRKDVSRPG